jgi:hypothetical protein
MASQNPTTDLSQLEYAADRWAEYFGELRVAAMRAVAIVGFLLIEELWFHSLAPATDEQRRFHQMALALAAGGLLTSLASWICWKQKYFPAWIPFVTVLIDTLLVTAAAGIGRGPAATIIVAFFLVIGSTTLRRQLSLVWLATFACMAAYMLLVGSRDPSWFDAEHVTPLVEQFTWLAGLGAAGLIAGQSVRQAKDLGAWVAQRALAAAKTKSLSERPDPT